MSFCARNVVAGSLAAITLLAVGSANIVAAYGPDRTIAIYNIHTKETLRVLYRKGGRYVPSAMKQINWVMRDWRRDVATKMDPKLVDLLWEIHRELGSKKPIHLISGFRSRKTNNMLRRTRGGQAKRSRHIIGSAADVRFPDVAIKRIRYSALIRERGGVGYYPTSATPFVHVDTGRVRHWPRMHRHELALLFPGGRTKHRPAGGGTISLRDVRKAHAQRPALAKRLAAYHADRRRPRRTLLASNARKKSSSAATAKASLGAFRVASLPKLLAPPRRVQRPRAASSLRLASLPRYDSAAIPKLIWGPTVVKRTGQHRKPSVPASGWQVTLASTNPRAGMPATVSYEPASPAQPSADWTASFAPAPAYDDEHPDELSYRPFPIIPLMGRSSNIDDPKLVLMRHPDFTKTYQMIGRAASKMPLRFRPSLKDARRLWATQYTGEAVSVASLLPAQTKEPKLRAANHHRVRTVRH